MKSLLDRLKIDAFLDDYPEMSMKPKGPEKVSFEGLFRFTAHYKDLEEITDQYYLIIHIHELYPKKLPEVYEPKNKIKPDGDHHINEDGSLCLGSRIQLWKKLSKDCSLNNFASSCLVPYLYGQSFFSSHGYYPFGELEHGLVGELDDVADILGLKTRNQAIYALKLLGMKKNKANKKKCPCGCNSLTGQCDFNYRLKELRGIVSRRIFRILHKQHVQRKKY